MSDTYDRRRERTEAEFADPALAHVNRIRLAHPREARALIERLSSQA